MSKYVLSFSSQETTLERAGGKGANLAALARAGLEVPPGFILTTNAYRAFIQANQFGEKILTLAQSVSPDDPHALEVASAEIRAQFERGALPGDIAGEIASAYRRLVSTSDAPSLGVAVRSSATAEDLPGLAFAGQQDTYLNVIGEQAVLRAVQDCWGSLWTARAIAYRAHNHIPPDGIALAVIVQQMVASETSGVLFTANPVTGRRDEMVIDASFGLGEAVVSGQVEPDHYVVATPGWNILERSLGAKEIAIRPQAGGGTAKITQDGSQRQALSDARILELAQTAQRVAEHFDAPQDVEWAWADGRLYLLQSRPITSLYPLPANPPAGLRLYVNFNFIQGVTDPITPLGMDLIRLPFSGILHSARIRVPIEQVFPEAGGRIFLDLTALVRDPSLKRLALGLLARTEPGARQIVARLIQAGRFPPQRVLTLSGARAFSPLLIRLLGAVTNAMRAPEEARERVVTQAEANLARVKQHARAATGLGEQLQAVESDLTRSEQEVGLAAMPAALLAASLTPVIDRWLVAWLGEQPGAALPLMRSLPHNVTTEMDLRLWSVAQVIRSDPAASEALRARPLPALVESYRQGKLPPAAQRALEDFLDRYGMRGAVEIDIGRLRWRDDPTPIFQSLRSYLDMEDPALAPDAVFRRGAEQAERLAAGYVARARRTRFGWLRAQLLAAAIRRMRVLAVLREVPLFYLVSTLDIYRTALLESARRLVARGVLDRDEDIFFIPLADLKRLAPDDSTPRPGGDPAEPSGPDLKSIAASNRAAYERESARRQIPHVLLSTGEAFYEGASGAASGQDLAGEAVSPGVAEGPAHVILDPRGARLEPGEILVCPSTDPGWTPLFLTAGGLVMEIGGMITHGSVVAREYGIPAVAGVHNATTRLKTGQRIRVDGNGGRVTVLESEAPGRAIPVRAPDNAA